MISAFGVDHGEISKGKVPLIPKFKTKSFKELGTKGTATERGKSVFLHRKATIVTGKGKNRTRATVGGGLTDAGKLAVGTTAGVGAVGAGGTAALVSANRRHRE